MSFGVHNYGVQLGSCCWESFTHGGRKSLCQVQVFGINIVNQSKIVNQRAILRDNIARTVKEHSLFANHKLLNEMRSIALMLDEGLRVRDGFSGLVNK